MSRAKSKDDALVDAVVADLDFDKLDERRDANLASGLFPEATKDPDIPCCDACGKEWSGNLGCSRCQSVFYCSKECQVDDWRATHKKECGTMKEVCRKTGAEVVEAMNGQRQMYPDTLGRLDMAGPYSAAVDAGLHEAMRRAFQSETDEAVLLQRCSGVEGAFYSVTRDVCCAIFRGERFEGKGNKSSSFGSVDAYRIKRYIQSDTETALDVWFDASIATFRIPLNARVFASAHHAMARRAARDIWAAWLLVMANKRAARAVLWNGSAEKDKDAIIARVKAMATKVRMALAKSYSSDPDSDPGLTLQGCLYQFMAMVEYHLSEYDIKLDCAKLLKLNKKEKVQYICASRLGVATIKKGRFLNNEETKVALSP